jgi:Holliday junction DNA helicase RuvA
MIAAIEGTIASRTGDRVVVRTSGGVHYELAVPVGVLERLPADGKAVTLRTVLIVRDDAWSLYGFDREFERRVFQRLLGATGVGPRLALAMVSALGGTRVVRAVKGGDLALLTTIPGIGKKTAERMVVELKDRLADLASAEAAADAPPPAADQAVQALVNLGYAPADAETAVRAVLSVDGAAAPAELIRQALTQLAKRRS